MGGFWGVFLGVFSKNFLECFFKNIFGLSCLGLLGMI